MPADAGPGSAHSPNVPASECSYLVSPTFNSGSHVNWQVLPVTPQEPLPRLLPSHVLSYASEYFSLTWFSLPPALALVHTDKALSHSQFSFMLAEFVVQASMACHMLWHALAFAASVDQLSPHVCLQIL